MWWCYVGIKINEISAALFLLLHIQVLYSSCDQHNILDDWIIALPRVISLLVLIFVVGYSDAAHVHIWYHKRVPVIRFESLTYHSPIFLCIFVSYYFVLLSDLQLLVFVVIADWYINGVTKTGFGITFCNI